MGKYDEAVYRILSDPVTPNEVDGIGWRHDSERRKYRRKYYVDDGAVEIAVNYVYELDFSRFKR